MVGSAQNIAVPKPYASRNYVSEPQLSRPPLALDLGGPLSRGDCGSTVVRQSIQNGRISRRSDIASIVVSATTKPVRVPGVPTPVVAGGTLVQS